MRTSTTFLLFAVIILGFVMFSFVKGRSAEQKPYMRAATTFMNGLHNHDIAAVESVIDPETVSLRTAGAKIAAVVFEEVSAYQGAFSARPPAVFNSVVLQDMRLSEISDPLVLPEGKLAAVPLNHKNKIYLRLVDGEWKVFYMSEPGADVKKAK